MLNINRASLRRSHEISLGIGVGFGKMPPEMAAAITETEDDATLILARIDAASRMPPKTHLGEG